MAIKVNQFFDTVTGLQVSDLSSTNKLVTGWIFVGPGKKCGATFVWTGTGSPIGTCGVEFSNDPAAGGPPPTAISVVGDAMDLTTLLPTPTQPAGTAGRMPLYFESVGAFVRFTYQRTNGGTGDSLIVNFHA